MMSRYKNAWLIPEKKADIVIKPYIGKMGSLGTQKDIELARLVGYVETQKKIEALKKLL